MSTKQLRDECFFYKAISLSSPLYCKSSCVILIYNNKSKIAFWKQRETAWNSLDDEMAYKRLQAERQNHKQ